MLNFKFVTYIGSKNLRVKKIFSFFDSPLIRRRDVEIKTKYKIPKNDFNSIKNDYRKIGKDLHLSLDNYERRKRITE